MTDNTNSSDDLAAREAKAKALKPFASWVAVFVAFVISALWCAFVFAVLWGWFVVPLFAAPHLTLMQAMGLRLVVKTFFYGVSRHADTSPVSMDDEENEKTFYSLCHSAGLHLIALAIGFIITLFM